MPTITSATRDESRILYLDGWRGCAILAVLFGHFGTSEGLGLGALGVELFFVLSGRLMAEILFERQSPLGLFFLRRISRVWPTMFAFITLMFLLNLLFEIGNVDWKAWLAAITFITNYGVSLGLVHAN